MKRQIELKHVGPKIHVRNLIHDLIDKLEHRLERFPGDSVSIHVKFEENGTHKLYRTAVTCHIPKHTMAAHEEGRVAGTTIRKAFAEIQRQVIKRTAVVRREYQRRRAAHNRYKEKEAE